MKKYSAATSPVALVTGASSGFGLLSAVELARRGLRVFASMRDISRSDPLREAARAAGVDLKIVRLDVTDGGSIADALAHIGKAAGQVEVLINNAGFVMNGFFEDVSSEEFREQFETNFFGVIAMTQAVLPGMRAIRRGRIVNVSSASGRLANPGLSAYCASKFALEGLSESLRLEMLPLGIQVVIVEPGTYKTEIFARNRRNAKRSGDAASPNYARGRKIQAFVDSILEGNTRNPQEVAEAIAHAATVRAPRLRYLVGPDARLESIARSLLPQKWLESIIRAYTGL